MTRTDADERALEIMTGREWLEASEGLRPSKYLRRKYGINARTTTTRTTCGRLWLKQPTATTDRDGTLKNRTVGPDL